MLVKFTWVTLPTRKPTDLSIGGLLSFDLDAGSRRLLLVAADLRPVGHTGGLAVPRPPLGRGTLLRRVRRSRRGLFVPRALPARAGVIVLGAAALGGALPAS